MPIGSLLGGLMGQGGASGGGGQAAAESDYQRRSNIAASSPWTRVGQSSQDLIAQLLGLGHAVSGDENGSWALDTSDWQGDQANAFSKFQKSPDYDFRRTEGINALDRSAASKGMLMSGAQTKGVQQYGSDLASGEYANWFNRLVGRSDAGLSATNNLTSANTALSGQRGRALQAQGDAEERGSNALAKGISGGIEGLTSLISFNPWQMFGKV